MTSQRDQIRAAATARQKCAANPATSAWVSANAGSGKTRVLIDRVARLLLADVPPSRILCITYTKAAAAEMSRRLFDRLGQWSMLGDEDLSAALAALGVSLRASRLGEARSLFARALETPGGLKIETIHAFCQRVLQRFPIEADVLPDFEVFDERESEALLAEAHRELFRKLAGVDDTRLADAVQYLLQESGEHNFREILKDGIKSRIKIERFVRASKAGGDMAADVRSRLGLSPLETFEVVKEACLNDPNCAAGELAVMADALRMGSDEERRKAKRIDAFVDIKERSAAFEDYLGLFFTQKGHRQQRLAKKTTLDSQPGLAAIIAREGDRLEAWNNRLHAAYIADKTIAAIAILERIFEIYEGLKRSRGALDYDDLIEHTLNLLRESANAWVHYKLDGGIDHVLIDEAQDTSPDQWEIVRLITDEFFAIEVDGGARKRSIFAVGDQKQSIYSFQGADPSGFQRMSDHFGAAVSRSGREWLPVDLKISFRSVEEVLRAVDVVFDSDDMRGALTAEQSLVRHEAERIGAQGLVELWPMIERQPDTRSYEDWTRALDAPAPDAPEIALANKVAAQIRTWLDEGTPLSSAPPGEASRAIEPGDVLILVRQRATLFYETIRALNRQGLPVAGSDRLIMRESAAYLDLDALGRFCLLPQDDLVLAEVLKGPFIGIGDDELYGLARGRVGSLWSALQKAQSTRLVGACDWLGAAIERSRTLRPFEFFKRSLDGAIGDTETPRKAFTRRLGREAQDVIGEFLGLALAFEREGAATLQGFLAYAAEHADVMKRDMEEAQGRIRVMTVHAAKGLESGIVFLIDTCTPPRPPSEKWLVGATAESDVVPLLRAKTEERDPVTESMASDEAKRQHAEYMRQLYVGMTRAADRLYIAGCGAKRYYKGSWHEMLTRALDGLGEIERVSAKDEPDQTILRLGREPTGAAVQRATAIRSRDLPGWIRSPVPAERGIERRTPSALLPREEDTLSVFTPAPGISDPFLRGRAIHKLLQLLPDVDERERVDAARRLLGSATYRPLVQQQREIIDEVLRLFRSSEFGRVFGAGSRAEVAIAGTLVARSGRKVMISGQIDRLLVTDSEILIVDFKTNRPPPATQKGVPRAYLNQMAAYASLLAQALPNRTIKAGLLYTAVPRLMALDLTGIDVTQITTEPPA